MANLKYIFITGGVISGLGKGIVTASISHLLEEEGFKTAPIKADPYLNLDAGTMNPIIHGETFVTEDGLETDQDLGHYERFVNRNLTKLNYMTAGQVFMSVIKNERMMEYKGECVEMIRHIPEEIIRRLKKLGEQAVADMVVLEVGGTVGDIQNQLFLEAIRQLKLSQPDDVLTIHVAYMPLPKNLGELKTKPVQQSVHFLLESGVQPDIIITRSELEIDELRKEKIAIFCNVKKEHIFSNPDLPSVYGVPKKLKEQGIIEQIKKLLKLNSSRTKNKELIAKWSSFVTDIGKSSERKVKIGIVGKYFKSGEYSLEDSYICVLEALKQAFYHHKIKPDIIWVSSDEIEKNGSKALESFDGLVVPQGWGSRGVEGKILTAKYARENKVPYLGLCFGMQLAVIEFARNVLGYKDANSTEINPETKNPVVHIMPHQVEYLKKRQYGGTIRLGAWPTKVKKGTLLWDAYEQYKEGGYKLPLVYERHRHRYEFNNSYRMMFEKNGAVISATSPDNELVEAFELQNHPFFVGVQYHPEFKARPLAPHPIFMSFLKEASKYAKQR
jgi:CTP synthase